MRNGGLFFENVKRCFTFIVPILKRFQEYSVNCLENDEICTKITRSVLFRPYFSEKLDSSRKPEHENVRRSSDFDSFINVFHPTGSAKRFLFKFLFKEFVCKVSSVPALSACSSLVQNKTLSHNLELTFLCRAESLSWNQLSSMVIVGIRPSFNVPS